MFQGKVSQRCAVPNNHRSLLGDRKIDIAIVHRNGHQRRSAFEIVKINVLWLRPRHGNIVGRPEYDPVVDFNGIIFSRLHQCGNKIVGFIFHQEDISAGPWEDGKMPAAKCRE